MIVEYIRYIIAPDKTGAFEQSYREAQESLRESAHCLGWELSRCAEDGGVYTLRIEWDSAEGNLQGFRKSPEFGPFFAAVQPFLGEIQEMRHYNITDIVGRKPG